ncbi:protein-glutamine gamma-glutamyltransferase TgpA [soil metagenome]
MKALKLPAAAAAFRGRMSRPMSRDKADTLLLLFSCVLVLAPHALHLDKWVSIACGATLLWRCWITFRGLRMPPRWLLLPIAGIAIVIVCATTRPVIGKESGVAMLVLLVAFKLLEMHARRDLFAVIFVCFFIMLTNFFYQQTIGTALMMVAAVVAILTTQVSFHYTGVVPPLRQRLRTGAMIFALAVPLTVILFILFPRIQGPLWGLPSDAAAARSGLSDIMEPGDVSSLALSDEIAFRVRFLDPVPVKSKLYWRGIVLGDYDGRRWTQLKNRYQRQPALGLNPAGRQVRHQVTLEPNGRRWLFALELPTAAPKMDDNPAYIAHDFQLLSSVPITGRIRYSVVSYLDAELQPNESGRVLEQWLQLPAGFNPRTLEFAAGLRSRSADNAQLVSAVLTYFRQQPFSYTLSPVGLKRDAVDDFLFNTREGFCEHYASAFVVIMRAAGIPSRVVTGYQGGEINSVDGFMSVRQSDAHAWAEVWLEKRGWVRVDPTAAVSPARIESSLGNVIPRPTFGGLLDVDGSSASWFKTLRGNLDAANNAWNQWVLNYTPDRQKSFINSLGFENVDWRTLTGLMLAFGAVALAVVLLPLLLIHRRKIDPVAAVYEAMCNEMARHGVLRAPHEGPKDFAARLNAEQSPLASETKVAATRFLKMYEKIRYGVSDNTPQSVLVSRLKSLLAECK